MLATWVKHSIRAIWFLNNLPIRPSETITHDLPLAVALPQRLYLTMVYNFRYWAKPCLSRSLEQAMSVYAKEPRRSHV